MDFKHQYINQSKAYILFIQDDQSRFIVGHTVTDCENVEDVLIAMEESIRIHGKPESIMTEPLEHLNFAAFTAVWKHRKALFCLFKASYYLAPEA